MHALRTGHLYPVYTQGEISTVHGTGTLFRPPPVASPRALAVDDSAQVAAEPEAAVGSTHRRAREKGAS